MQYILLIYGNEAEAKKATKDDQMKMFAEYKVFTEELKGSGKMLGGDALESVTTATTVRVQGGKTLRTDGPFAETREQLGGFYAIEAKDLDEAVMIAAKVPGAKYGCIEVRPVMRINGM
ncbi:MAG TPA: YciI family protein [Polyangiaceae bacterium]|nr:YciI family protein [Polyangiaceae bacterium]